VGSPDRAARLAFPFSPSNVQLQGGRGRFSLQFPTVIVPGTPGQEKADGRSVGWPQVLCADVWRAAGGVFTLGWGAVRGGLEGCLLAADAVAEKNRFRWGSARHGQDLPCGGFQRDFRFVTRL